MLHINGRIDFTSYHAAIFLPYELLISVVPFLENSRTPGRFFVLAALSFSVLAGYGICELLKAKPGKKVLLVAVMTALIIFEFSSISYPMSYVDQPEFYKKISQDKGHYALIEIPATKIYAAGAKIKYYQVIHGKPIVGGHGARIRSDARDFELNTPLVREITYLQPNRDILDQNLTQIGASVLNYYNVRYIIIHKDYMSWDFLPKNFVYFADDSHDNNPDDFITAEQLQFVDDLLRSALGAAPQIYENDSLIVYEVPKLSIQPFMTLKSGFYGPENWSGTPTRWMGNDAEIFVYSETNHTANLAFRALSFNSTKTLDIYTGDTHSRILVPADFMNASVQIDLRRGPNSIRFHLPEGCEMPCANPTSKNNDCRCLGLALQDIKIV